MGEARRAQAYEALYPGAVSDEGQRAERMERISFKDERDAHHRTGRQRGVVIPELPWLRKGAA